MRWIGWDGWNDVKRGGCIGGMQGIDKMDWLDGVGGMGGMVVMGWERVAGMDGWERCNGADRWDGMGWEGTDVVLKTGMMDWTGEVNGLMGYYGWDG